MTATLAIVLPTLNERDNIGRVIAAIETSLGPDGWEAIVVDDNSSDGTAEEARALARRDPRIRVIQRFGRRGLASAAIEGMCATAAPLVAVMDADLQHDPSLLPSMCAAVESGECDIAVASRFVDGGNAQGLASERREMGSRMANRLARKVTGVALSDPMSGFFVLRTDAVRAVAPRLSGIGFKILLDIVASANPTLKVREFPLVFEPRQAGESKLDSAIAFEFLVGLYDRAFGQIIPSRYALFGTVGAVGVAVHMLVLSLVFRVVGLGFVAASALATFAAMTFNFWLNNRLTYRDRRLTRLGSLVRGWIGFCATCAVGALANVGAATMLERGGIHWILAALAGIVIGSVWNYALSSRFVWGRY